MARYNVGVIGVGYWGKKLVDEFTKVEEARLVGVSDLDEKNLQFCADRHGIKNGYTDYRQLLAQKDLHAVSIAVPNAMHYAVCKDALEAGKHVLVEKPITLKSTEGRELVELADKNKLTLSVGHIFRFNNALSEIRRMIGKENHFGKLFLMELNWHNLEKTFHDRDVLFDLAPHMFDIQNYLLGEWPVEVSCIAAPFRRREGEETAYVISRFKSGIISMCNISWLIPKKTRQIFIAGEERSALIDAVAQKVTIYESGYTKDVLINPNNTIRDELIHFIQSFSDPQTATKNSGVIGVKTVELIEAAKLSMKEGRVVRI
ncbi:MAG: Gfo/Idh/MocA family oxidoreductase [Candidatus Thermoplasmatota archaeon]|nr:Gfo/Idh/MocA family oxidoreductase [Candidatus Thermoplasmatota archaeon]